jgi:hypothetical protein
MRSVREGEVLRRGERRRMDLWVRLKSVIIRKQVLKLPAFFIGKRRLPDEIPGGVIKKCGEWIC